MQKKRLHEKEMGKIMTVIFKCIGFVLMFVFLGILGIGVFLFYIVKKLLEPEEMLEVETDDWGEMDNRQPNTP